jgi:hypothetical protein
VVELSVGAPAEAAEARGIPKQQIGAAASKLVSASVGDIADYSLAQAGINVTVPGRAPGVLRPDIFSKRHWAAV